MTQKRIETESIATKHGGAIDVTPGLLRKARKALGCRVPDLSAAAGIPAVTIYAHEARRPSGRMQARNNDAVYRALCAAGVVFHVRKTGSRQGGRQIGEGF